MAYLPDLAFLVRGQVDGSGLDKTLYLYADGAGSSTTAGLGLAALLGPGNLKYGSLGISSVAGGFGNNVTPGDLSLASAYGKDIHLVSKVAAGNAPTRMIITNSGSVGIGQNSANQAGIGMSKGNQPAGYLSAEDYNATSPDGILNLKTFVRRDLYFQSAPGGVGQTNMLIRYDTGNVGIGIGSSVPAARLHVGGGDGRFEQNLSVGGSVTVAGTVTSASDERAVLAWGFRLLK